MGNRFPQHKSKNVFLDNWRIPVFGFINKNISQVYLTKSAHPSDFWLCMNSSFLLIYTEYIDTL